LEGKSETLLVSSLLLPSSLLFVASLLISRVAAELVVGLPHPHNLNDRILSTMPTPCAGKKAK